MILWTKLFPKKNKNLSEQERERKEDMKKDVFELFLKKKKKKSECSKNYYKKLQSEFHIL